MIELKPDLRIAILWAIILSLLIAIGCAAPSNPCRIDEISIGMTSEEVIDILGKPASVGSIFGNLYFSYYCDGEETMIRFDDNYVSEFTKISW